MNEGTSEHKEQIRFLFARKDEVLENRDNPIKLKIIRNALNDLASLGMLDMNHPEIRGMYLRLRRYIEERVGDV